MLFFFWTLFFYFYRLRECNHSLKISPWQNSRNENTHVRMRAQDYAHGLLQDMCLGVHALGHPACMPGCAWPFVLAGDPLRSPGCTRGHPACMPGCAWPTLYEPGCVRGSTYAAREGIEVRSSCIIFFFFFSSSFLFFLCFAFLLSTML